MMSAYKRHQAATVLLFVMCIYAVIYFTLQQEGPADARVVHESRHQYIPSDSLIPLAIGTIAGEEGVFVEDEYQGMAVHVQTPGALPGRTLALMLSDTARVYPREYVCAGVCGTFLSYGYVSWPEFVSLTHKEDCKPPLYGPLQAYCEKSFSERQYTFYGTMQERPGRSELQILGDVHHVVEE